MMDLQPTIELAHSLCLSQRNLIKRICGKENTDNWPITVKGEVKDGGCQECWEVEYDAKWWEYITLD